MYVESFGPYLLSITCLALWANYSDPLFTGCPPRKPPPVFEILLN